MMMKMVINIDHLLRIMNNKYLSLIFSDACLIYCQVKYSISISIFPTIKVYDLFIILFNTLSFTESGCVRYSHSIQHSFSYLEVL